MNSLSTEIKRTHSQFSLPQSESMLLTVIEAIPKQTYRISGMLRAPRQAIKDQDAIEAVIAVHRSTREEALIYICGRPNPQPHSQRERAIQDLLFAHGPGFVKFDKAGSGNPAALEAARTAARNAISCGYTGQLRVRFQHPYSGAHDECEAVLWLGEKYSSKRPKWAVPGSYRVRITWNEHARLNNVAQRYLDDLRLLLQEL